jgi:hypothetical protein
VVVPYRLCVMIWQCPGLIGNHSWAVRRPSGRPPALGIHQRLHALIHRLVIESALAENPAISRLSRGVWGWQREMRQNDFDLAET